MAHPNLLEVSGVNKFYGRRRAVGPLDFTLGHGEIVGLVGLNGAGKTTTLRMLASDLQPTSGRIVLEGFDVEQSPVEVRSRLGFLPDRPPLYPEFSVREQLELAAGLWRVSGRTVAARVNETLERADLTQVASQPIGTLSLGYRQRVGIAQAIVHGPRLLVLDEPTSGLDPHQIVQMRHLLRGLRDSLSIVISSHILSEVSETCDRILLLDAGKVVASGTEAELRSRQDRAERTILTVRANDSLPVDLGDILKRLPGVIAVRKSPTSEPAAWSFEVETLSDLRASLARSTIEAGFDLLGIARTSTGLEGLFLGLVAPPSNPEQASE